MGSKSERAGTGEHVVPKEKDKPKVRINNFCLSNLQLQVEDEKKSKLDFFYRREAAQFLLLFQLPLFAFQFCRAIAMRQTKADDVCLSPCKKIDNKHLVNRHVKAKKTSEFPWKKKGITSTEGVISLGSK